MKITQKNVIDNEKMVKRDTILVQLIAIGPLLIYKYIINFSKIIKYEQKCISPKPPKIRHTNQPLYIHQNFTKIMFIVVHNDLSIIFIQ